MIDQFQGLQTFGLCLCRQENKYNITLHVLTYGNGTVDINLNSFNNNI